MQIRGRNLSIKNTKNNDKAVFAEVLVGVFIILGYNLKKW